MLRDEVNAFLEQIGLSPLPYDQALAFKLNIGNTPGHVISLSQHESKLIWCYSLPIAPYEQERVLDLLKNNSCQQQRALVGFTFSVFWRDDHLVILSYHNELVTAQMLLARFSGLIELIKNQVAPMESRG